MNDYTRHAVERSSNCSNACPCQIRLLPYSVLCVLAGAVDEPRYSCRSADGSRASSAAGREKHVSEVSSSVAAASVRARSSGSVPEVVQRALRKRPAEPTSGAAGSSSGSIVAAAVARGKRAAAEKGKVRANRPMLVFILTIMNDSLWSGCSQAAQGRPARAHDRHDRADELSDGEFDEEEV